MDCLFFKTNHCRSCELLDLEYQKTLSEKEKRLLALFQQTKAGTSWELKKTVGLKDAKGTRNKAKLAVSGSLEKIEFGFYDQSLQFKKLEECPLHMSGLNELLPYLKTKLKDFNIPSYSVSEKKGELKYVILSRTKEKEEFLLRFVLRSKESLDRLKKMAASLEKERPSLKVITANIQPEHKAVLEGEEEIVLSQEQNITHSFGSVHVNLGPRSFFQVTPAMAQELYEAAGRLIKEANVQSFLDLYCGVGAFSFFAAQHVFHVYGVEISKEAIASAKSSIPLNQVKGVIDFSALDVEKFLQGPKASYEAVLVNPPRRGLNANIVDSLLKLRPQVIIYSSCNAETLARDCDLLAHSYEVKSAQVFDMFPYTEHFETLMLLHRKDV